MADFRIDSFSVVVPVSLSILNVNQQLTIPFADVTNLALEALSTMSDLIEHPVQQSRVENKYNIVVKNFMTSIYVF